jgi:acetamidase/formamidase
MPNVVDPGAVPESPARMTSDWDVDMERGIATLMSPETTLGRWSLPVNTMVGCFGVAPADGQAISAATSGPHGGNMDYRGFCPGVTAYLPVFVPGALFTLGDGHAIQADGEILGAGIDISLDVRVTLRVIKGWTIGWPRGEDETYIFTAGNARPLDQALQHATTEMLRWLQADYGLDPYAAHILLGQTVRYDVGNCIDPAYTMICKVPKSVLPPRVGV